jgi:hypothetical protein
VCVCVVVYEFVCVAMCEFVREYVYMRRLCLLEEDLRQVEKGRCWEWACSICVCVCARVCVCACECVRVEAHVMPVLLEDRIMTFCRRQRLRVKVYCVRVRVFVWWP